jgi:hypothetical protein
MTHQIKVTDWQGLGNKATEMAEYFTYKYFALYNLLKDYPEVQSYASQKSLPSQIRIPPSMDLIRELSYFAPTIHAPELDNNIIEFVWE